jgi:hypothetical protein
LQFVTFSPSHSAAPAIALLLAAIRVLTPLQAKQRPGINTLLVLIRMRRWGESIKIYIKVISNDIMDWIYVAEGGALR